MRLRCIDVGDGLAAVIYTIDGTTVQIDCGSQQNKSQKLRNALCRPDVFILSHFHNDHYNGLFHAVSDHKRQSIRDVYFPRMPQFADRRQLFLSFLSMNAFILGSQSGSERFDFLNLVSQINDQDFNYRAVSAGDTIVEHSTTYDVIWPPKYLKEVETLASIRLAINDFNEAVELEPRLKIIRDTIGESNCIHNYLNNEEGTESRRFQRTSNNAEMPPLHSTANLSDAILRSNRSLQKAANRLSMVFHEDNKLLFMGDLEKAEITQVVHRLVEKKRRRFWAILTPHHGTHWHDSLNFIDCRFAISSAGPKMLAHVSEHIKNISEWHLVTHLQGDIHLPLEFSRFFRSAPWQW